MKPRAHRSHPSYRSHLALANEDSPSPEQLEGLANEYTLAPDGWVRIAPYGDSIKERQTRQPDGSVRTEAFLQRLDRPAAQQMVDKFGSIWGKVKRFLTGLPIYKRHPDLADHAPGTVNSALANDRSQYGMFSALEARDDGFYGRVIVSPDGRRAIENEGLKYLSPFWWAKPTGEKVGCAMVVKPHELISAGLTDRPNIPGGEALANQAASSVPSVSSVLSPLPNPDTIMEKSILISLLASLSVPLANDATDAQISDAIKGLGTRATAASALENEKATLTASAASAATELATVTAARTTAETAAASAATALANERKLVNGLLLDQAIAAGRITAAQRPAWEAKLDADVSNRITLADEKPTLKTTALANVGDRKAEAAPGANSQAQFVGLVQQCMKDKNVSYQEAWLLTKQSNGDLYNAMAAPVSGDNK